MSTPETTTPTAATPENLTVAIIDQSDDVREFARDAADARLTAELNGEGGKFRRVVRNIWKGNFAREYYRQKYIREATGEITDEDTLYANREDIDEDARTRARVATIDRFVADYEGSVHTSAGEQRKDVSEAEADGETGASLVTSSIKGLIQDYAEGRLDDDSLLEERTRVLGALRSTAGSEQLFGEGVMVADNIVEIAQNVRAAIAHGEGIESVMERVRVVSAEARSGARTEAQYNKVDKIIEKLNKSKVGLLVNEATIATAVSVVASMARFGSTKVAAAATMTIAPGIGAGLFAGLRENKRVKDERRQHAREMSTGQDYDRGNARRRDAMQETLYETRSAESLIEDLVVTTDPEQLDGADEARLRGALDAVLEAQTRVAMSDERGIDLIGFTTVAEVETERMALDIALAQAKVNLRHAVEAADVGVQHNLGFDDALEFAENIANLSEAQIAVLEQDITEKDKAFKALQRREVAKTTAKAVLIGMGIGLVAQEVKAMLDSSTQGLVEQLWHAKNTPINGQHHESMLFGLFGAKHGSTEIHNHAFSGDTTDHVLGHGTKLSHSSEYTLHGGKGHYELIDPSGKHVNGIEFDKNGALTPESIHKLRDMGLTVHDKSTTTTELITSHRTVDVNGWVEHNQAGTTHVTRDLWYDNNTPSPKFDQNELRVWWGGAGNTGVDQHGNYVFTAMPMTANGSFHGAESVNWHDAAASGHLKMVFSATRDSQNHVFSVPIGPDGQAVIPKDGPIAEMFTIRDGHAVFQGKYAEVVQTTGVDKFGVEHIRPLATHVGEDTLGGKPFDITTVIPKTTPHHAYEILGSSYNTTEQLGRFVEMAPVIPIYGRKPLENLLENTDHTPNPYYFRRGLTPEVIAERRRRFSPRIVENPDAELDQTEEVEWYFDQQSEEHLERVRGNAEQIAEQMSEDVKVVVTIPVAGHQEADNIYRTLEAYTTQTLDASNYEIVLYVNHPETDSDGNALDAADTLAEIERFKRDHPDMPIRVMHEALPRDRAKIGYIRKVLVDTALMRHQAVGSGSPLAIVSNDADTIAINPNYLEVMLRELNAGDDDAVVGQVDWDNRAYVNYPEVHIGTRLFQFFDVGLRVHEGRVMSTSGANTAFSAASYAAVGGYDDSEELGEDVVLGRDFLAARDGTDRTPIGFGGVVGSRIETSARRSIFTWLQHHDAPYRQWHYPFGADDDDVRGINVDTLSPADLDNPTRVAEIISDVEHVINATLKEMGPEGTVTSSGSVGSRATVSEQEVRHLERALHFMGIQFEWAGSYKKIRITDASRMISGLREYAFKAVRKDMIDQGVPTEGGMMMVNGKLRRANGQFMTKREQEAIMRNLPKIFGATALQGS